MYYQQNEKSTEKHDTHSTILSLKEQFMMKTRTIDPAGKEQRTMTKWHDKAEYTWQLLNITHMKGEVRKQMAKSMQIVLHAGLTVQLVIDHKNWLTHWKKDSYWMTLDWPVNSVSFRIISDSYHTRTMHRSKETQKTILIQLIEKDRINNTCCMTGQQKFDHKEQLMY